MIAIIEPVCKSDEFYFIKWKCLYSSCYKPWHLFFPYFSASKIVVYKANFYPFLRFFNQKIYYFTPDRICIKNIIFNMNMILGIPQSLKNFWKLVLSILQYG